MDFRTLIIEGYSFDETVSFHAVAEVYCNSFVRKLNELSKSEVQW